MKRKKILIIIVLIAVVFSMGFLCYAADSKKGERKAGVYTVYLDDSSLTKVGSYDVKSVNVGPHGVVVYDSASAKITVDNGQIIIKTPTEVDAYTNAFILKDQS